MRSRKTKTIGDAYMAAGGMPEPLDDHAARVVDLGLAMIGATQEDDRFADLRLRSVCIQGRSSAA